MINRFWVDLRTSGVYIVDSFIKDPDNPKSIVAQWDACYDEFCEVYYVPLSIETEANSLCEAMNDKYNSNK